MRHICVAVVVLVLVTGCGGEPTPTPDAVATQIAVEKAAHATMTAEAPTATDTAEPETPTPTDTAVPTETPTPTSTPTPTWTPTPRPTRTPTPTDTPSPTVEPYEVWKKSARTDIAYKMVDKSDAYIGERVCWHGEIFNMEETLGITFFQAWYGDSLDAFAVFYDGFLPEIFQGDVVDACGFIGEKFEGTNAYGATIIQPKIEAVHVVHYKPPPKPTAKPKPTKAPTPTPKLAQIGEEMKAGHWLFTVTEVQWHKALYLYDTAKVAMGVYCVLFLDIQNQASGTTHFGELWWELHGARGAEYDDDSATFRASWQFGGKDTHYTDLNPGQRAQIVIAFDVAEGAKGLQFYSYKLEKPFVLIGDAQPAQDQ